MAQKILLLHGAFHSSAQFSALKKLLGNDFEIFSPDLPGHGKSDYKGILNMQLMADHILEYVDENKLTDCVCFGYSMGGYAALSAEANSPGTFSKIFTLATKYLWTPEISAKEAAMLNVQTIKEKVPQFAAYLNEMHGEKWTDLSVKLAEMLNDLGRNPLLSQETLEQIEIPVRVAVGDKDRMVGIEETVDTYRQLQKGSLQVFPDTVHPLDRVDVNYLATELKRFFG